MHQQGKLVLTLAALCSVFVLSAPAQAKTIKVNSLTTAVDSYDNLCTLPEAMRAAEYDSVKRATIEGYECQAGSGDDTILLPEGSITLDGPDVAADAPNAFPPIGSKISLEGKGTEKSILLFSSGRFFQIARSGNLTIKGITFNGGKLDGSGGSAVNEGTLVLDNCRMLNSEAGLAGGAIANYGNLEISKSFFNNNQTTHDFSQGGVLFNAKDAKAVLSDSILDFNRSRFGGGIINLGEIQLVRTKLQANQADFGGGIYNNGKLQAVNSLFLSNPATRDGGGFYNDTLGDAQFESDSFLENFSDFTLLSAPKKGGDGAGIFNLGKIQFHNTIIAKNIDQSTSGNLFHDCAGTLESKGYNFIQRAEGCTLAGETDLDITLADPLLQPSPNFSPTLASRAVNAGDPKGCGMVTPGDTDLAGNPRVQQGRCDIGAFESAYMATASTGVPPSGSTAETGGPTTGPTDAGPRAEGRSASTPVTMDSNQIGNDSTLRSDTVQAPADDTTSGGSCQLQQGRIGRVKAPCGWLPMALILLLSGVRSVMLRKRKTRDT